MKTFPRLPLVVFVVWTAIAVLDGLTTLAYLRLTGHAEAYTWVDVFRHPLVEQWIWAALTPGVFWMAGRVPLRRPGLARALVLHAGMFVLLSALHGALAQWLDEPLSRPEGYTGPMLALRLLRELYSDLWMYWPLVGLRALMDVHAREREQERQAARLRQLTADLKLSLLRAQIQPHFLFNTLHAISALLKTDPRAADDLVSDLADILRAAFADATAQQTSLAREIELVGCYLRIQQHRLGDRLRVEWHVDEDARGAGVPALALQSLVENAVVHGLAPQPRGGTLEIRATREGDQLHLVVRDDGAGLSAASHEGVGLANTRERLAQMYGDAQSFSLDGAPGRGTTVEMRFPFRAAPDERAIAGTPREAAADAAAGAAASLDPDSPRHDDDTHPDRGRRAAGPAQPVVAA